MVEIGHGIDVYYGNDYKNNLLFPDGRNKCYYVGSMLMEMTGDEAEYLLIEKLNNMIKIFPEYQADLNIESITDAFGWIYETVVSEELPVLTEIFRGCFSGLIKELLEDKEIIVNCTCVGEFMMETYKRFIEYMRGFWLGVEAIANTNSDIEDSLSQEMTEVLKETCDKVYPLFCKKCSNQRKKKTGEIEIREIETYNLKTPIQILIFEYSRMRKTGHYLKKCANCCQYFVPEGRKDTIFCNRLFWQDSGRTCREIGAQVRRQKKIKNDPVERNHQRKISRIRMNIRRGERRGDDVKKYKKELWEEEKRYDELKGEIE